MKTIKDCFNDMLKTSDPEEIETCTNAAFVMLTKEQSAFALGSTIAAIKYFSQVDEVSHAHSNAEAALNMMERYGL